MTSLPAPAAWPEPALPTSYAQRVRVLATRVVPNLPFRVAGTQALDLVEAVLRWTPQAVGAERIAHRAELDSDALTGHLRRELADEALRRGLSLVGPVSVRYADGDLSVFAETPLPERAYGTAIPADAEYVFVRMTCPARPMLTEE